MTRLAAYLDDARFVTVTVTLLIAAGLWLTLSSWMSAMMMMDGQMMGSGSMSAQTETIDGMGSDSMTEGGMTEGGMTEGGMTDEGTAMGDGMPMDGMTMDGMAMGGMMTPGDWSAETVTQTLAMWLLMMAAMMLPAMAPVMATYAKLAAKEDTGAPLLVRLLLFFAGYFVLWAVVSIALGLTQLGLRDSAFFTMGGTVAGPLAAAFLLIAAGLYQFTGVKDACLRHCRHPLTYLLSHWRPGIAGAFPVGLNHGVYCVGCCVVFMGLMFVFGAMALWWMALISLYFVAEKILPKAELWGRAVGVLLVASGAGLLAAHAI